MICPHCKTIFNQRRPDQKWCSRECKGLASHKRLRRLRGQGSVVGETRLCRKCQGSFSITRGHQRFCSIKCREKFYRKRVRATRQTCHALRCGKIFSSKRLKKYCSRQCAKSEQHKRKSERLRSLGLLGPPSVTSVIVGLSCGFRSVIAVTQKRGPKGFPRTYATLECPCGTQTEYRVGKLWSIRHELRCLECPRCSGLRASIRTQNLNLTEEEIHSIFVNQLAALMVDSAARLASKSDRLCSICSTSFVPTTVSQRRCSSGCRAPKNIIARQCRECCRLFTPKLDKCIFCSPDCRRRFHRKQQNTRRKLYGRPKQKWKPRNEQQAKKHRCRYHIKKGRPCICGNHVAQL